MKLSQIFLLGVSFFPFQTHAMYPLDGIEDIKNIKVSQKNFTDIISLGQHAAILIPRRPLEETIPLIESLIQKVIEEKIEIPLKVRVLINGEDILLFHEVFRPLVQKYPFPFSWSLTNKGLSNLKDEQDAWVLELSLSSQAKERERVEKEFVYKISDEDRKKINWQNIYDVAMRSGFAVEDFKFNNSIKVRTLELKGKTEAEDTQAFQQFLEQILPKDESPFHILNIAFNRVAKGHYIDMLDVFLRKVDKANVGYHSRGMVFDSEKGLLYLCLDNTHRKILNLHGKRLSSGKYEGRSVKQAGPETQDFVMQGYEAFLENVTVLTGRGNHINPNGQKGILKEAFEEWIKTEPFSTMVKQSFPIEGEGGHKVIFKKIQNLTLNNITSQNFVTCIKETIAHMVEQKKTRLHVILTGQEGASIYNREFKLITSVYADIYANNQELAQLITPLSFEAMPGDMKIIFNKRHSKCPSFFTFSDSYGSRSAVGTIHFNGYLK